VSFSVSPARQSLDGPPMFTIAEMLVSSAGGAAGAVSSHR
jgi:hypothetical protein